MKISVSVDIASGTSEDKGERIEEICKNVDENTHVFLDLSWINQTDHNYTRETCFVCVNMQCICFTFSFAHINKPNIRKIVPLKSGNVLFHPKFHCILYFQYISLNPMIADV